MARAYIKHKTTFHMLEPNYIRFSNKSYQKFNANHANYHETKNHPNDRHPKQDNLCIQFLKNNSYLTFLRQFLSRYS